MTKQKILIVDDEPRNQRILSEILEEKAELKTASTGEEALSMAEGFQPHLVLLDIMMRGIDGYEVCRKLRSNPKHQHTKVILVSGKAMVEERLKGYEAGADDYITKPFVPEELMAKAKVFLKLAEAEAVLEGINRDLERKVADRSKQLVDTEYKLLNAAKMSALGEMAGGIAHEINTPLGVIGVLAGQIEEILNEEEVDKASLVEMSQTIQQTVKRIGLIIHGLKNFSRDGSKDSLAPARVKDLIESTLSLCNEKLKHSEIKLQIDPIPENLSIPCRAVQISQVLLNIISNACDAIAALPEKWIKISLDQDSNYVQISVTDSGEGIPEDVRDKIFQPFFTTKEIGKGTGLGLSISKGILEAHRGSLSLDVSSPNTRFTIGLPKR